MPGNADQKRRNLDSCPGPSRFPPVVVPGSEQGRVRRSELSAETFVKFLQSVRGVKVRIGNPRNSEANCSRHVDVGLVPPPCASRIFYPEDRHLKTSFTQAIGPGFTEGVLRRTGAWCS